MKLSLSGPDINLQRNQVYDLPEDRAVELVSVHYATPVAEPLTDKRERATRRAIETR